MENQRLPKHHKRSKEQIQVTCRWNGMGRPAAVGRVVSKPCGLPSTATESFLAILLSLLSRRDDIITQGICAHLIDLAHLKQHIGLHVICGAARIRTTARSGRSNDHGKHPRGQCGAQPHIVTKAGLPGKRKENGTKSIWATGIEPKFAGTRNLLRNKQREQVQASPAFTIQAISVMRPCHRNSLEKLPTSRILQTPNTNSEKRVLIGSRLPFKSIKCVFNIHDSFIVFSGWPSFSKFQ